MENLVANKKQNVKCALTLLLATFACSSSEVIWPKGGPPLNDYFSLEIKNEAYATYNLKVDADMPGHGHGMITRPEVTALEPGRWQVDGMIFHMPGLWELYLIWDLDGQTDREIQEIVLED